MTLTEHLSQLPLDAFTLVAGLALLLLSVTLFSLARLRSVSARAAELLHAHKLLEFENEQVQQQLVEARAQQAALLEELKIEQSRAMELDRQLVAERVRASEQLRASAIERQSLADMKDSISKEFESLANRVLESKQLQFGKSTEQQVASLISPFREQLLLFNQRLEAGHKHESDQRSQLLGQIIELQKQSQEVRREAVNLTNALKGNTKTQGMWGEFILETVLEQSGLVKGREYHLQPSHSRDDGKRYQPDAVVHLPQQREVVIDAKVSLVAYERLIHAEDFDDAQKQRKLLVDSFRAHIKGLSGKAYSQLFGAAALDFVLMFVPLESAFIAVIESSPELLHEAYRKGIVIVSPSSLLVVLKTIENLWSRQRQNDNVSQIVTEAGKLYDQFVLFSESIMDVGDNIARTDQAFRTMKKRLSEGRGNLVKRAEDLKTLGAKASRSLPKDWLQQSQSEDDEPQSDRPL